MADGMSQVRAESNTPIGARLRLQAVGKAYLEFARTEPGLFDTAFTETDHPRRTQTVSRNHWHASSKRSTPSSRRES